MFLLKPPGVLEISQAKPSLRKLESRGASKGLNIGPVRNVLGVNDKQSNLFITLLHNLICAYCGYLKAQIGGIMKVCSKCKRVVYCSRSCQVKERKTHKQFGRACKDSQHKK